VNACGGQSRSTLRVLPDYGIMSHSLPTGDDLQNKRLLTIDPPYIQQVRKTWFLLDDL
jgi:hypothetical protein